jgi:GT2 family glycosyltransferase
VSDNGSTDGSIDFVKNKFPAVILIENNQNLGFGAANNRGLKIAKGEFVFFLNSDTVLLNNAVNIFYTYWKNYDNQNELGALGCNLTGENNEVTDSYGTFFNLPHDIMHYFYIIIKIILFRFIKIQKKYKKRFGEVDMIVGADIFMKNDANARFDEYFFLYHEEADLQFQLAKKNKKRILIDGPEIIHFIGESDTGKNRNDISGCYFSFSRMQDNISRVKYYKKNSKNPLAVFILKILILLIWIYPPAFNENRKYFKELIAI